MCDDVRVEGYFEFQAPRQNNLNELTFDLSLTCPLCDLIKVTLTSKVQDL